MRIGYSLFVFFVIVLASCSSGADRNSDGIKPNVILVFIDDMGYSDFSCFGNTDAKTPHVDRMAAEGLAFEQFYVNSPICSPSRVAISTGQYPQRWKITSYLAHRDKNKNRDLANWLDPKAPMLARTLQRAGYATGHFGKWHMGGQRDVVDAPEITEYGFNESLTNFEGMGPKLLPLTQKPGRQTKKIWADAERLGQGAKWMQRSKITSGFVDAALAFIKKSEKSQKPFYVNVWPDDVHSPFFPPLDKWGKNKRELYLSVLEEMDSQLAKLFDYVRENPTLRNNTLILICSDNGHEPGAGRSEPFKGCKTTLYEGGIRSPLIVWGPGFINKKKQGLRNEASVLAAIDLAPSILKFCGVENASSQRDGLDMSQTIIGSSTKSRSKAIYFSRPPDRKSFYGFTHLPDLAVREGKWKFLCDYDGSRPELYDLEKDPSESNNLAKSEGALVKEMTKKVKDWYQLVK